jgi:periplasmic protein TonB
MRFLIASLLISVGANAQETPTLQIDPADVGEIRNGIIPEPGDNKIYNNAVLQVEPGYPGGTSKLQDKLLTDILKSVELPKRFSGKLYLAFVVEKDGSLSDIRVLRDPGYKIGLFAERLMRGNKVKWSPGVLNGIPVRTLFTLPVEIKSSK